MNNSLPDWLTIEENYIPKKDCDNFIDKSILGILRILSKIKTKNLHSEKHPELSSLKLAFNLFIIILISCSSNFYFILAVIAGILLTLTFLDVTKILTIFKFELYTLFISCLILLPSAIFMHNYSNLIFILLKIYATTTIMMIYSFSTQWNTLSSSLKKFRIPDTFIFIFDLTLKYIILLGNISLNMLIALKLRSVGINNNKRNSLASIAGTTFIKSTEMCEDTLNAMECRGFTGEYKVHSQKIYTPFVLGYLILAFLSLLLFLYLE